MKKITVLVISLFFLLHFSPQTLNANESEESTEKVVKETEQIDSEEETSDPSDEELSEKEGETNLEAEKSIKASTADLDESNSDVNDNQTDIESDSPVDVLVEDEKSNERVIELRNKLSILGFPTTDQPEDHYGEHTEQTVTDFQNYYGLESSSEIETILDQLNSILNTPFKQGGKDDKVIELKENLVALGFGEFVFNINYGSKTAEVVEAFQEYYGLKVNGIADDPTWDKLTSILDTPLRRGGRDESVTQLKRDLVTLGFGNFNFNQTYGSTTEATVKEFQTFYDLKAHGVVDSFTQDKMDELLDNPMQRGDYRKDVVTLKEKLAKLGFIVSSNPTPQYGPATERNVREFQEYFGLEDVTGIADSDTLEKLDEILSTPLQRGGRHEDVIQLKEDLVALGFGSFNFNQSYGSTTEATVKEFQEYYGLRVNGIADPRTLDEIQKVLNSPLREGQVHEDVVQLKQDLVTLGFGDFNFNQNYFSGTAATVEEFQTFYELRVNGIVDSRTREKLDELLDNPMQRGDYRKDVVTLKEKLAKLGFVVSSNPTPQYGPATERNVREFQEYYGLKDVTGTADSQTLEKLDELVSTPLQRGGRHEDVIQLKEDLVALGFGSFNFNQSYGSTTEATVKEFQEYYGLRVNGMADERTLDKLDSILDTPLKRGGRDESVTQLKRNLVTLGFGNFNFNQTYGSTTEATVKEFQTFYDLKAHGVVDHFTQDKLDELLNNPMQRGDYRKDVIMMKEKLAKLGFVVSSNPTPQYGPATERNVREFQEYYGLKDVTGIADSNTLEKLDELLSTPLQRGGRHEDVIQLKKDLVALGFGSFNFNQSYGSTTEATVEEFQAYYGLRVNGMADPRTLDEIQKVLNSPLREGQIHDDVVKLKQDLDKLGFGNFNFNRNYFFTTARVVGEFQEYYGLKVNQIADQPTLNKIQEVLNSPLRRGQRNKDVIKLKEDLAALGFGNFNFNNNFGSTTESVVMEFQETYDLVVNGIADEVTLAKIKELLKPISYTRYNLTLAEALNIQMRVRPQTDQNYAYVSANYVDSNGRVTVSSTGSLNVRSGPRTASDNIVGQYTRGDTVKIISKINDWYQIEYSGAGWVDAARADVAYYLDPSNFINNNQQKFQFLDLSRPSGATQSDLSSFLKGKGILNGMGQAFIDAGRIHGVNDVYLLSHALLETGHGTSKLATGVKVNGKTVYNMYGIGAKDHCAVECGSQRAYDEGWFTPEAAIIGGAKFIGQNYVNAGQNTLYKMRWNPAAMAANKSASHQYATDIGWASKQLRVLSMYDLYRDIGVTTFFFDVPEYLK
ncbi:peptidoglycan-binding protein [Amphibacillus sp. Q70]|uniref:peptidoglycan-binding protein n=1 Tax=Amphibacillus sp. Q70 TaxID=3453416 RepID=UPI003F85838D